jgi:aromatic-L-amino-acid decarboxylase
MTPEEFRSAAHKTVDWIADYLENIRQYPVKSQVKPRDIFQKIPKHPPETKEEFASIMADFEQIIMPGITHWQHPNFHSYFPANSSYPSLLAEMITAGLGAQCMIWDTSPAAAELEEKMMEWLKEIMNLPTHWHGVIQDTASTATLVSLLTAREEISSGKINSEGFSHNRFRVYCSSQTHSSIDKAVKVAGIGIDNLIKIDVNSQLAMNPKALDAAIRRDLVNGFIPLAVISTLGTTGTLAMDPVEEISEICIAHQLWHHIDAAYAGTAFCLPEFKKYTKGFETADSYVFNPHKWMFTNFDCTAYYVRDKNSLLNTFEILPEYLKTSNRGEVNDYRDWGIPLGRRFRALKLWFVLREYGVNGIKSRLREHISYAQWLEEKINEYPEMRLIVPREMNMVVFRYEPVGLNHEETDAINEKIVNHINQSGKAYLTHTRVNDQYVIRLVTGQTYLTKVDVESTWNLILETIGRY